MFLEKLFLKKTKKKEESPQPQSETPAIRDIDIEISYVDNFLKFDIKEDCDLLEYAKALERKNIKLEDSKITNNVLFDEGLMKIKRKTIYIFSDDNTDYNIYSNEKIIYINAMIHTKENNHIDERIIEIDKETGGYRISNLKHDEIRSTYFVKFYSSEKPEEKYFQLGKENALFIAQDTLENLRKIPNINTILDLELVSSTIGLSEKKDPIVKKIGTI